MKTSATVALLAALLAAAVQARSLRDAADDYCAACVDGQEPQYRLVRGADEVAQCESGHYCNCATGKRVRCIMPWSKLNPDDTSACQAFFDCQAWLGSHPVNPTPAPTTPPPSSPSPAPSSPSPAPSSPSPPPSSPSPAPSSPSPAPSSPAPSTPSPSSPAPSSPSPSTPSPPSPSPPSSSPAPLPQCPPQEADTTLPDPSDCGHYIRCSYGRAWRMACPAGTWYGSKQHACVFPDDSDCVPSS